MRRSTAWLGPSQATAVSARDFSAAIAAEPYRMVHCATDSSRASNTSRPCSSSCSVTRRAFRPIADDHGRGRPAQPGGLACHDQAIQPVALHQGFNDLDLYFRHE